MISRPLRDTLTAVTRFFDRPGFYALAFTLLLCVGLRPYYMDGRLLLGGEGNFVLDYTTYLKNFYFSWNPLMLGTGIANLGPMAFGTNIVFLSVLERLSGSVHVASFTLIFLMYFTPFSFMMAAVRRLGLKPATAFLIGAFYVLNPFSFYFLNSLNPWNVFVLSLLPMSLWVCLRFLDRPIRLFLVYGLLSAVFSFGFTNYPLFAIFLINTLISLATAILYQHGHWRPALFWKGAGALVAGFLLFSLWWILPLRLNLFSGETFYVESYALGWLNTTVEGAFPIWPRLFLLSVLIPRDLSYDFFAFWYHQPLAYVLLLIPALIIGRCVFFERTNRRRGRLILFLFSACLIALFLAKGNAFPFGFIYVTLFKHVPFFSIFKTPVEKFGLLYTYLLTVLLGLCMQGLRSSKVYRWALMGLLLCIGYSCVPLLSGHMISGYKTGMGYIQRDYKEGAAATALRHELNADPRDYRLLGLPGVGNYQVCLLSSDGGHYTGIDPVLMNLNKSVIVSYNDTHLRDLFFHGIGNPRYAHLLGLFNVRTILVNGEQYPWFGSVGPVDDEAGFAHLFSRMPARTSGPFTLYDNGAAVLPHIYAVSASEGGASP